MRVQKKKKHEILCMSLRILRLPGKKIKSTEIKGIHSGFGKSLKNVRNLRMF